MFSLDKTPINSVETTESCATLINDVCKLLSLPSQTNPSATIVNKENEKLIRGLTDYRNFLIHAIIELEIDPNDDVRMFNAFLNHYSLRVPFEIEKYIDEGDIIEIYTEDFVQFYRNKTFLKFCSYDLYTILAHPFDVLFRRDPEITRQLFEEGSLCFTEYKDIQPWKTPAHFMQEHFARNECVYEVKHKWCSPVYSVVTGKVLGGFVSQRATLFGRSNVTGIGFIGH